MWKRQEERNKPSSAAAPEPPAPEKFVGSAVPPSAEARIPPGAHDAARGPVSGTIAHLGKSVQIKGELSGSEDLQIDGTVEGNIELRDHHLTVGASGKVHANINAKKVVILGAVKGNIRATDGVEICKSGSLIGDMIVAGVSIEEGAYFKGSIDIQKTPKAAKPDEPKKIEPGETGGNFAAAGSGGKRLQ